MPGAYRALSDAGCQVKEDLGRGAALPGLVVWAQERVNVGHLTLEACLSLNGLSLGRQTEERVNSS